MATIYVGDDGLGPALQRFKSRVARDKIISDYRRHQAFIKKRDRKRRARG